MIRCPHCDGIIWGDRNDRLRRTYDTLRGYTNPVTTRHVADVFGLSIQAAHNRLAILEGSGLVRRVGSWHGVTGDIEYLWRAEIGAA